MVLFLLTFMIGSAHYIHDAIHYKYEKMKHHFIILQDDLRIFPFWVFDVSPSQFLINGVALVIIPMDPTLYFFWIGMDPTYERYTHKLRPTSCRIIMWYGWWYHPEMLCFLSQLKLEQVKSKNETNNNNKEHLFVLRGK